MISRARLVAFAYSTLTVTAIVACSQPMREDVGRAEQRSSVAAPTVYNVVGWGAGGPVACQAIATPTGTWNASRPFSDDLALCTYAWSGGASVTPDAATLTSKLGALGVGAENINADSTCTSGTPCVRPTVSVVRVGGGGTYASSCQKCVAAVNVGDFVDVALPPDQVTAAPSPLFALVNDGTVTITQPGNAALFRVPVTETSGVPAHVLGGVPAFLAPKEQPLSCGNNNGQIGATCGTISSSTGQTLDCGGCAAMSKCDPGSETCIDDPSQCAQACGGAGAYCASHTCLNYCGTNPISSAQVGVSTWLGAGRLDVSSPPGYGSNNCQDQLIIETASNDSHAGRSVVARPTAQISQADCPSTAVMLTSYASGQQVATTGWVQAKWFTSSFGNYCGFDVTCASSSCVGNNSLAFPSGPSVARVAVAASHGSFVKGTWSGSPIPVTASVAELLH